ncbi:MAG TPA: hypothetical protein VH280_17755 [Verrucomicrobiae bacterium]|jgi:hypothetical protein|nr:hypothetical protein [Verrucomicrobiae bacterium]
MMNLRFAFLLPFAMAMFAAMPGANDVRAAVIKTAAGLSVQLDAKTGGYRISTKKPDWQLAGSLHEPLKDVAASKGADAIGRYRQLAFDWQQGQTPMSGQIRIYEEKLVALFSQTCRAATETAPPAFPDFTALPGPLHVFSYGHHEFAPPKFVATDISTPWLLFDDQANAFVVSPASHFMVASMSGDGEREVASGFNPAVQHLPANFTQQTVVAFGHGINRTWDLWGSSLRDLFPAKRPSNDADPVLKYLGYWTDNGSTYYYNYNTNLGYAGTLKTLVASLRREEIPIHYLQLDSWWYDKSTMGPDGVPGKERKSDKLPDGQWNAYGGLLKYEADPWLFPDGLDSFQKSIGLPLVTHNRWIDPASPYHQLFEISGVAAVDPKWWGQIASYLKSSGIITYEQDWLDRIYTYSPAFSSNVETGEAFLDDMACACGKDGITMQYCMPYPCYFLEGSRYENLTTIRTSGDRFNPNHWNDFLYTSRLAESMGIWPWTDVYMSGEINNLLISTLSAGPVGIGDAIGAVNKANLLQAVRADGVIVKPDAPIVPLDSSYLADANEAPAPLTASTCTDHDGIKTAYVFAFNRPGTPAGQVRFSLGEVGLNGRAYVYDYFSGTGQLLPDGASFSAPLGRNGTAYYVVAPIGPSGIAFLGDRNKFVGTGRQRIALLHDEPGELSARVVLATNESEVVLHGYAAVRPKVTVISGEDDPVKYDPASHYFTIEVKAAGSMTTAESGADAVRRLTVILSTKR